MGRSNEAGVTMVELGLVVLVIALVVVSRISAIGDADVYAACWLTLVVTLVWHFTIRFKRSATRWVLFIVLPLILGVGIVVVAIRLSTIDFGFGL